MNLKCQQKEEIIKRQKFDTQLEIDLELYFARYQVRTQHIYDNNSPPTSVLIMVLS